MNRFYSSQMVALAGLIMSGLMQSRAWILFFFFTFILIAILNFADEIHEMIEDSKEDKQ